MNATMLSENILAHFHGVRPNGPQWKALCPAHEDKNPSLSIREANGKILIYCFAGCAFESVLAAAGIDATELFADDTARHQIAAEYDYTDEQGNLLFQVVRFLPKDFRQRRPDGQGGWIWNLKGVRRVLYRLPDFRDAQYVYVLEGEKDVEAARKLELVATCNPGGAGKWKLEFSEQLYGKCIHILADADEPGRKHAQAVAASLYGKVESLKLLELPGAKDLTDWIERGGEREVLVALFRDTPEWQCAATRKATIASRQGGFSLTSLGDLLREPAEDISWLLENKLPSGGLSVLCAKPKVGKSTFARCLSLKVSRGDIFLNCATKQGPVIYLALEEKRAEVRRHFDDLGATGHEPIYIHAAGAPHEAMRELRELTDTFKPTLIVIDPLFKFLHIRDEKAYAEVCTAIEPLLVLARESNAHVLVSHHSGKASKADATDTILGSTAIFGGVDSAIILKKSDRYRTVQSCQRYGVDWPEIVLNFDPEQRSLSLGVERSEAEWHRIGNDMVQFLAGCEPPPTRVQIEAAVEGKTTNKRAALKALVAAGSVSEIGAGTKGDPFRYALNAQRNPMRNPCSVAYTGTQEHESEATAEEPVNIAHIVVPSGVGQPMEEPDGWEQDFLQGKL